MSYASGGNTNKRCIKALTKLTDNNEVVITQNKHLKVIGLFGGEERSFTLCTSPSSVTYEKKVRSQFKRFIKSLNINKTINYPFF